MPTWSAEQPDGRWPAYGCEEVIAREVVGDLETALGQFRLVAADVGAVGNGGNERPS